MSTNKSIPGVFLDSDQTMKLYWVMDSIAELSDFAGEVMGFQLGSLFEIWKRDILQVWEESSAFCFFKPDERQEALAHLRTQKQKIEAAIAELEDSKKIKPAKNKQPGGAA